IQAVSDVACESCGKPMVLRQSRHGPFLGCSGYPECDSTLACDAAGVPLRLVTEEELELPCEQCGQGTLKVKRRGAKSFLACDAFPKCKATQPLPDGVRLERKVVPIKLAGFNCEKCGRAMLIRSGTRGDFIACSGFPSCRHTKKHEKLEEFLKQVEAGKLEKTDTEAAAAGINGKKKITKGGKKTYHLMIACYFHDLSQVWHALRRVCTTPSRLCFVIGDSAPYGVYVPVVEWLSELSAAAGFTDARFERTRDRNIKWKNRKHRVPLCEGRLWVNG
ncbi:MAG: topoisomerase DNA-binding C4 zinc finger domain-containing protein, partial [Planctomycetes bacterium]|nr:topoisomerase DNA-binding C4 zinc finger domain-containing protein [Planctomycetota bacterium]